MDIEKLQRTPKGELLLDAKACYREGKAMLSVYGFLATAFAYNKHTRTVLHRVFVPRETPKVERAQMLRAMCDLVTVESGMPYRLRSKLKS